MLQKSKKHAEFDKCELVHLDFKKNSSYEAFEKVN